MTDAEGNQAVYTYDALDQLISIDQYGETEPDTELPASHHTDYIRNSLGQLLTVRDALGNEEHYQYDAFGRIEKKQDREGYETAYTYTGNGDIRSILYGDGRKVQLSYDALRKLTEVKDWIGITKIENDRLGRTTKVQYPDGKSVSYTYNSFGERTSLTYPDGRSVYYGYDEKQHLAELRDGEKVITYSYDSLGRLTEKQLPNEVRTEYGYDERGNLKSLIHKDREGILDRYCYGYDQMGNKTFIEKERRGLEEESGQYCYGYDALSRLTSVTKDNRLLREYSYDVFGNRESRKDYESGKQTGYEYNTVNQLIEREETGDIYRYLYDKRGNLIEIYRNNQPETHYQYGALNRLERAEKEPGRWTEYLYNGLGHRIGKEIEALKNQTVSYTLDLTKPYHNLLQKTEGNQLQQYLWDNNAVGIMGDSEQYYLQDELGSPIHLMNSTGRVTETYGYDEFGQELYPFEDENQKRTQPFGYTGYQYNEVAGTYYAQAREYKPELGRFVAEDVMKGTPFVPATMNQYGYCWNNPMMLVDLDGKEPNNENGSSTNLKKYIDNNANNTLIPYENNNTKYNFNYIEDSNSIKDYIIKSEQGDEKTEIKVPVFVMGISGSLGAGAYISGGAQLVIDANGNIGIQTLGGVGVEMGAAGNTNIYIGGYSAPSVYSVEGFGVEEGGTLGELIIVGAGAWQALDQNRQREYNGGYISIGLGGEATVLSGHVSMADTVGIIYLDINEWWKGLFDDRKDIECLD